MALQYPLFDGWDPSLVRPAALWPTVDRDEVAIDEQARWVWPTAFGDRVDDVGDLSSTAWWHQPGATVRDAWRTSVVGEATFQEGKDFGLTGEEW